MARVCLHVFTLCIEHTMSFPFPVIDGMWHFSLPVSRQADLALASLTLFLHEEAAALSDVKSCKDKRKNWILPLPGCGWGGETGKMHQATTSFRLNSSSHLPCKGWPWQFLSVLGTLCGFFMWPSFVLLYFILLYSLSHVCKCSQWIEDSSPAQIYSCTERLLLFIVISNLFHLPTQSISFSSS